MFRELVNSKIGNLLNYMSSRIPKLGITKALKLLYIIDETSYSRTGATITWLEYKVWEKGPVAEELYNELRYKRFFLQQDTLVDLSAYIETIQSDFKGNISVTIYPKGNFDLSEFSQFEIELIDNVLDRFGAYTSNQLVDLLHEQDSLWHKAVADNNLKLNFEIHGKKSNHTIDFSELIKEDQILQMAAQSAFESLSFQEKLSQL